MNVLPPPDLADPIGPLITISFVARDLSKTPHAIRGWLKAGSFPQPICFIHGVMYWRHADYMAWKREAVAGKHAGSSRAKNLPRYSHNGGTEVA